MKYFLIIVGTIIVLLFLGHRYVNSKLISSQERAFEQLASTRIQESPRRFPDSLKLSDSIFWKLIKASKAKHPDNFDFQMEYLTEQLSKLPNEQIVGFEMTVREKVIELWDYNIKSLYQIIYGDYVSTDVFIYFRFWIVSNGEEFYRIALRETDELAELVNSNDDGEGLLYVADNAYLIRNGNSSGIELPRDQSFDVDYDFGNYKMTGTYIEPDDFEMEFPKLTAKFW